LTGAVRTASGGAGAHSDTIGYVETIEGEKKSNYDAKKLLSSDALKQFRWAGLAKADDIMLTGPKCKRPSKKEILDLLLNEDIKALRQGAATRAGDYIDRHDVDSILYLGRHE